MKVHLLNQFIWISMINRFQIIMIFATVKYFVWDTIAMSHYYPSSLRSARRGVDFTHFGKHCFGPRLVLTLCRCFGTLLSTILILLRQKLPLISLLPFRDIYDKQSCCFKINANKLMFPKDEISSLLIAISKCGFE